MRAKDFSIRELRSLNPGCDTKERALERVPLLIMVKKGTTSKTFIVRMTTRSVERYDNLDIWARDKFDIWLNKFEVKMYEKGATWDEKLKNFLIKHLPQKP